MAQGEEFPNTPAEPGAPLPWAHFLRRGWQLVRNGQLPLLLGKLFRVFQALAQWGCSPRALLDRSCRTGAGLVLIFDHDLGGGANTYRVALQKRIERDGLIPVVVTAHRGLPTLRLEAHVPGGRLLAHARGHAALFDALAATRFREVVFNDILSFPAPADFLRRLTAWLAGGHAGAFVFLAHDHYCVCPSFLLLNAEGRYCGVPSKDVCAACLPNHPGAARADACAQDIDAWRTAWSGLLRLATEVRCFSGFTRDLLTKAYPELAATNTLTVVPHRLDHVDLRPVTLREGDGPVVGVIGRIESYKGSEVVHRLAEHIRSSSRSMRIVVIGTIEGRADPGIVHVTGPYRVDQLPRLIETHGVNVGLFPSICPETFSYVTEEMIRMGLPLVAFGIGAQGERVAGHDRGAVVPLDASPADIADRIDGLYDLHVCNKRSPH